MYMLYIHMYYTEIALIVLIVVIAYMRPRMISGVVRTSLGKLALVVAVLLVARYTNRNSGILAAIVAISLIHIAHQGIEGMDGEQQVPPPLTDDDQVVSIANAPAPSEEQEDKCQDFVRARRMRCRLIVRRSAQLLRHQREPLLMLVRVLRHFMLKSWNP